MVDAARLRALLDRLRDTEAELRRLRHLGVETVRDDTDRMNIVLATLHGASLDELARFRRELAGRVDGSSADASP